ncbi:hypothetical protein BJV82DRAFT_603392 [Fennellomyces sp. T-0311]|nr:hypothetical protein BJV82DRAFT_603392 [Fennellomyces sp. T-0311]
MEKQVNGDSSANKKYAFVAPPEEPSINAFPTLDGVVTIENCHYYLSLMERFMDYKESFDTASFKVMLARAEIRYAQWREIVQSAFAKVSYHSFSPPLDVAYMWHVHMLSPFRYFEDSIRLSQQNLFNTHLPLESIHPTSMNAIEADANASLWKQYYGLDEPYTLTPDNVTTGAAGLPCSFCRSIIECSWTDYTNWRYDSTVGLECRRCRNKSTVGTSSLVKLAHDMEGRPCLIAGLLLDGTGRVRTKIGSKLQATVDHCTKYAKIRHPNVRLVDPFQTFGDVIKTIEGYQKDSKVAYAHRQECTNLVNAIYACYHNNPSPFSIDLIQAVGRQQDFNSKTVKEIDWQVPFGIARGIRQYHKFLHLMFTYPGQVMVPTLEIDLAWHTHMLHPSSYQAFTHKYLGRMINHDDNIAPEKLKEYSNGTDKAWSSKNGRPLINSNNNDGTVKPKKRNFINRVRNSFSPSFKADFNSGTLPDTSNLGVHNNSEKPMIQVSYHDRRSVKSLFGLTSSSLEKTQDEIQKKLTRSGYGYIGTVNCASESITVQKNETDPKLSPVVVEKKKTKPVMQAPKPKPKPKPVKQAYKPKPKATKTSYGSGRTYSNSTSYRYTRGSGGHSGGFFGFSGFASSSGGGGCGGKW